MLNCSKILAVGLHLATIHSQDGFNDINPGAYIRTDCNIVAGAYYNSESNMSAYAGMVFEKPLGRLTPFIVAGVVVGYESYPVGPLLTPGIAIEVSEHVAVRLAYLPGGIEKSPHGLHAALEFKF